MFAEFPTLLAAELQKPLPGENAHWKMAHKLRVMQKNIPDNAVPACVLSLFFIKNDTPHLVLMERVSHFQNDKHKGQISFPGGKWEPEDSTFADGALRETHEEIGVAPEQVRLLGKLTPLYIPVSNFMVYPFVGFCEETPIFQPDSNEVAGLLEVPLVHFFDETKKKMMDVRVGAQMTLREMPYYDVAGQKIWGATAMILSELLEVVQPLTVVYPPLARHFHQTL